MKSTKAVNICSILLYIFYSSFSIVWALYTGAWCPYQTEKVVPCRTRNGSEPYYGPNICWRNDNGSYSCTKKILYRPKFVITYKKVAETKYKCCPGRIGVNCENECFNCTTYKNLEDRVAVLEKRLSRLEYPKLTVANHESRVDFPSPKSIFIHLSSKDTNSQEDSLTLNYAALHSRLQGLLEEFRNLKNRIRLVENEMSRLNSQVDEMALLNNIVYDYGIVGSSSISSTSKSHESNGKKDHPDSISDVRNRGEREPNISVTAHIPSVTTSVTKREKQSKKEKEQGLTIRVLEENLERGDIASTLNDDYGDEIYNDSSTEQYSDQLQLKP